MEYNQSKMKSREKSHRVYNTFPTLNMQKYVSDVYDTHILQFPSKKYKAVPISDSNRNLTLRRRKRVISIEEFVKFHRQKKDY